MAPGSVTLGANPADWSQVFETVLRRPAAERSSHIYCVVVPDLSTESRLNKAYVRISGGRGVVAEFARISVCLLGELVSTATESLATFATTRIDNLLSLDFRKGLMKAEMGGTARTGNKGTVSNGTTDIV